MKVLVFGAGPMGSLLASRMDEAGHDVTVLARGKRLEEIRTFGIILQDNKSGANTLSRVKTTDKLLPNDSYDLIMVVMRYNQAIKVFPVLAANRGTQNILFMMNNAAGPGPLIDAVGAERAIMGFPLPGGERRGHVMSIMHVHPKFRLTLPIGDADGKIRPRTRRIAQELGALRGYKTEIRSDMDAWLKHHAALLMPGFAAALYATGTDLDRFARTRDARVLAVRATKESIAALVKCGYPETPRVIKVIRLIPEPLLVGLLFLITKVFRQDMQTAAIGHVVAARDEMKALTDDLRSLWQEKKIKTPNVDILYKYFDPRTMMINDGAKSIKMKWKGLIFSLVFGGLALQQIGYMLKALRRERMQNVC